MGLSKHQYWITRLGDSGGPGRPGMQSALAIPGTPWKPEPGSGGEAQGGKPAGSGGEWACSFGSYPLGIKSRGHNSNAASRRKSEPIDQGPGLVEASISCHFLMFLTLFNTFVV